MAEKCDEVSSAGQNAMFCRAIIIKHTGVDDNPEMITTFQLGGDALGNAPPHFLLARDLILSQFLIDCCQNPFASGALPRGPRWGLTRYSTPRPPAGKFGSQTLILWSADTENEPPFPNPGYGPGIVNIYV